MWVKSGPGPSAVLLLKPQTYMNLSGPAVQQAADYFQIELPDVLVVVDDVGAAAGAAARAPRRQRRRAQRVEIADSAPGDRFSRGCGSGSAGESRAPISRIM